MYFMWQNTIGFYYQIFIIDWPIKLSAYRYGPKLEYQCILKWTYKIFIKKKTLLLRCNKIHNWYIHKRLTKCKPQPLHAKNIIWGGKCTDGPPTVMAFAYWMCFLSQRGRISWWNKHVWHCTRVIRHRCALWPTHCCLVSSRRFSSQSVWEPKSMWRVGGGGASQTSLFHTHAS